MDPQRIPDCLKSLPRWICYRLEVSGGRMVKVPYVPGARARAKANDPATWTSFDQALAALNTTNYDGLGFELGDGIFGVDLDGVVENGQLSELAQEIVNVLDSYTEYSPSGTGVHILCRGRLPDGARRSGCVEMYESGRFFTVTGHVVDGRAEIHERSREAAEIHAKYLGPAEMIAPQPLLASVSDDFRAISDACEANARFAALWSGDVSRYGGDHSRADLALLNDLARLTDGDAQRMDALFRQSGLMRGKWDKRRGATTYGGISIAKALADFSSQQNVVAMPGIASRTRQTQAFLTAEAAVPEDEALPSQTNGQATPDAEIDVKASHSPQDANLCMSQYDYMADAFQRDTERLRGSAPYLSGFSNLDKLSGGLHAGLYVLGAGSSLGKTTFALQLCDQVAEQGGYALYFTLEQTRFELASKSLSRTMMRSHGSAASTALEIRAGAADAQLLSQTIENYSSFSERIFVIEGDRDAASIAAHIERFLQAHPGVKPLVVVDYLQILAPTDSRQSDKERVDSAVRALKKLQLRHGLPLIVISSLNRTNYLTPIDFESFKESGGIEYTADVVWGLQLREIALCADEKRITEKRARLRAAKQQNPRKIELLCLKNRYGVSSYACGFDYDARFDSFREDAYYDAAKRSESKGERL